VLPTTAQRPTNLKRWWIFKDSWPAFTGDELDSWQELELLHLLIGLPVKTVADCRRPSDPWFHLECRKAKRQVRHLQCRVSAIYSTDATVEWMLERRAYRDLLRSKPEPLRTQTIYLDKSYPHQLLNKIGALKGRAVTAPHIQPGWSIVASMKALPDKSCTLDPRTQGCCWRYFTIPGWARQYVSILTLLSNTHLSTPEDGQCRLDRCAIISPYFQPLLSV